MKQRCGLSEHLGDPISNKEVKIVWICNPAPDSVGWGHETPQTETEKYLATLLNDGWVIVTAGGGSAIYGFIVLQRDSNISKHGDERLAGRDAQSPDIISPRVIYGNKNSSH